MYDFAHRGFLPADVFRQLYFTIFSLCFASLSIRLYEFGNKKNRMALPVSSCFPYFMIAAASFAAWHRPSFTAILRSLQ